MNGDALHRWRVTGLIASTVIVLTIPVIIRELLYFFENFPLYVGRLHALAEEANLAGLREAVKHLMAAFPDRYSRGIEYLTELDTLEEEWRSIEEALAREDPSAPEAGAALCGRMLALKRKALINNPLICGHPILFIVRKQYLKDHHNTATLFQKGEINTQSFTGGACLKTIDFKKGGMGFHVLSRNVGQYQPSDIDGIFSGFSGILEIFR